MTSIEREDGTFQIDAAIVAEGMRVSQTALREEMRAGRITGVVERGTGADAGRHRLSFLSGHRRFRVVIDDRTGEIIQRSSVTNSPPAVVAQLDRTARYSRDGREMRTSRGVLDAPAKPGQDSGD